MKFDELVGKTVLRVALMATLVFTGTAFAKEKENPDHSATCTKSIAVARTTFDGTQPFLPEFVAN